MVGCYFVALAILVPPMQPKLVWNLWQSTCFSLPSGGITDILGNLYVCVCFLLVAFDHQLDTPQNNLRESQLRDCLHQIGLWSSS